MRKPHKLTTLLFTLISLSLVISCSSSPNNGPHYSEEWSSDNTYHWHKCTDEGSTEEKDRARHTFNYVSTADGHYQTCTVCNYKTEISDHSYSSWKYSLEDKTKTRTCTLCKYNESVNFIPVTNSDDFSSAISAAEENSTIVLFANIDSLDSTIEINKNINLDLHNHIIKSYNRVFSIHKGTLDIANGTIEATISDAASSAIFIDSTSGKSELIIEKDTAIKAPTSFGITAYGVGKEEATINIYGTIESANSCLSSDSDSKYNNFRLNTNIYEGAVLTSDSSKLLSSSVNYPVTIYQPNQGSRLDIDGATIISENGSAIEIRAGQVTVRNSTFITNSSTYESKNNDDTPSTIGAAFAVSLRKGDDYIPSVTVTGGVFQADNQKTKQLAVVNPLSLDRSDNLSVFVGDVTLDKSKVDAEDSEDGQYVPISHN